MIGILNCDLDNSSITNGARILHRIVRNSEIIDLTNGNIPDLNRYQGFIITGSRANYDDDYPWINYLRECVLEINRRNLPCLGICFGMQIIADCFGGRINRDVVDEEGFTSINIKDSPLFFNLQEQLHVFQSHHDIVTEVPDEALIIAENDNCIQAFQINNFFCVQFHPEISANEAIIMARRDNLNANFFLNGMAEDYSFPVNIILNFIRICRG